MLRIEKSIHGYYILLVSSKRYVIKNEEICEYLGIKYLEYIDILKSHGARDNTFVYCFKRIEAARTVIKKLEPYIIMAKLNSEDVK